MTTQKGHIHLTGYRRKNGVRRRLKLYRAWVNMKARCRGTNHDGRGNYRWKGLAMDFENWSHFRQWALEAGFSKTMCSLDRIDRTQGYSPVNCQWLTKADNCRKAVTKK